MDALRDADGGSRQMTATTTERLTLADAAQDVVDSARYETECYVTVNRIDGLEACIPEARAIDAATRGLLAAAEAHVQARIGWLSACERGRYGMELDEANDRLDQSFETLAASARALRPLIGGEA